MIELGRNDEVEIARPSERTATASALGSCRALPLVVCATPFLQPGKWRWYEPHYADRVRWEFFHPIPGNRLERSIVRPDLALMRSCWHAVRAARRGGAKLLITHDPRTAFRCATLMRMTGSRLPHVAWSFNFTRLPVGLGRRMMAQAFADVDRFVVFSTMERELYGEVFGIPAEKVDVVFWGAGEPTVTQPEAPIEPGEYICAVGGNARDYPLLMAAMTRLPDIPLVAVMRPGNAAELTIPPHVRMRVNLPLGEAHNITKYSRFMVLPLAGSEVPCGHVTLVTAMHLGKAFIVTDSSGVRDYVQEGVNSLTFEAHSVESLAGRIRELWDDPERCARLGTSGRRFAAAHCGEASSQDHLDAVLRDLGVLA
jgi:glycosyltransferase involved in cell wall biosynthesis